MTLFLVKIKLRKWHHSWRQF